MTYSITIPEDEIYIDWNKDDEDYFCHEGAIAQLLLDETVFIGETNEGKTSCFFVNCNDVFAWACADGEDVKVHEIKNLYEMHMKDRQWGSTKWCILKRGMMPQKPILEAIKIDGSWDLDEKKLEENHYD